MLWGSDRPSMRASISHGQALNLVTFTLFLWLTPLYLSQVETLLPKLDIDREGRVIEKALSDSVLFLVLDATPT